MPIHVLLIGKKVSDYEARTAIDSTKINIPVGRNDNCDWTNPRKNSAPSFHPRSYFCSGVPFFSLVGGTIPLIRMYVAMFP